MSIRAKESTWLTVAIVSLVLLLPSGPQAAELVSLAVSNNEDEYLLESVTHLDASVESVFQVLMDYDNFTQLSSVYEQSRYLEPGPDGVARVYTLAQGCILFVCRNVEKVERLVSVPDSRIEATVIPELSNLEEGVTTWQLSAHGDGTRLIYRMELVPKFWVPPLIGPPIIRYVLAKGGEEALQRLEDMARKRDSARGSAGL